MHAATTNNYPTDLHRKLPVELREQIERDLRTRPPGRSTYRQVWEHYELEKKFGISEGVVEAYGLKIRNEARAAMVERIAAVAEMREAITGKDAKLDEPTAELLYGMLFEQLTTGDRDPGDIRKLASAINMISKANERRKLAATEAAITKAETVADPKERADRLREDIRAIYGLN